MLALYSGFGETYTTTTDGRGSPIPSTGSPQRISRSAETGLDADRTRSQSPLKQILASDVDPNEIRIALRQHSQRVIQMERERVGIAVYYQHQP